MVPSGAVVPVEFAEHCQDATELVFAECQWKLLELDVNEEARGVRAAQRQRRRVAHHLCLRVHRFQDEAVMIVRLKFAHH